jgi:hypothetical protein
MARRSDPSPTGGARHPHGTIHGAACSTVNQHRTSPASGGGPSYLQRRRRSISPAAPPLISAVARRQGPFIQRPEPPPTLLQLTSGQVRTLDPANSTRFSLPVWAEVHLLAAHG